ncbi:MAG: oligosaccharide flippase family protein [Terriglobia bacterium]
MKNLRSMCAGKSALFRDTLHLSIGQGAKLVIQAVYFVLIARSLGPTSYGAFVAITALTGIASPFCGLGSANLFIKNLRAGRRTVEVCWGNGLVLTVVSGIGFTVFITAANFVIRLHAAYSTIFIVALCDLVFMSIANLAAFGFAADGDMKQTAFQSFMIAGLRLAGIVFLVWRYHTVTLHQWVSAYVVTGILGAIYALWIASHRWGIPAWDASAAREDTREGIFFSMSTSAQSIYNDIDKTMLGRLSTLGNTGIYGAAYRFIDVSMTPVRSLINAAYPRFFKTGSEEGLQGTRKYALRLIAKSVLYGVAIFLGLTVLSPAIPLVLGHKYDAVVPAIRWLAVIPLLRCIHSFLADALAGANLQGRRTVIQIGVAVVNVLLNLWVLPRWSWRGAAWTSIASDGLLAISLWVCIQLTLRGKAIQRTALYSGLKVRGPSTVSL